MQLLLHEEELTAHELWQHLKLLEGKRCWFRLNDIEQKIDKHGVPFDAHRNLVATVLRVYAYPGPALEIRIDTTEGVLAVGEFFEVEVWDKYGPAQNGKSRYEP